MEKQSYMGKREETTYHCTMECRSNACSSYHSLYRFTPDYSQPIWLDEVNCTQLELHLLRCDHRSIGRHDCTHTEDIAVECSEQHNSELKNDHKHFDIISYKLCSSITFHYNSTLLSPVYVLYSSY